MTGRPDKSTAYTLTAGPQWSGKRIDLFLADQIKELTRSRAQKLFDTEAVRINDHFCRSKNYRLQEGDRIKVIIPEAIEAEAQPEAIALDIIYEDQDLLVINKPRGMVVHPAPGHSEGTLVNALLSHCSDLSGIGGVIRPGIVHRLDKDTSGLLIAAKNDFAHTALARQLKERTLKREYLALVCGRIEPKAGKIEAPVGRHPRHRKKMAVVAGGREAVTRYRVIRYYRREYSLLRVRLETGRTHQIRVHMAYLGHPVAADQLYGKERCANLPEKYREPQALHARKLSFVHPRSGSELQFTVSPPPLFKELLHWLHSQK